MRICKVTANHAVPDEYDLNQVVVLGDGNAYAFSKGNGLANWVFSGGTYKIVEQFYPSVGQVAHELKQNAAEAAPLLISPNFINVLDKFKNFSIEAELK